MAVRISPNEAKLSDASNAGRNPSSSAKSAASLLIINHLPIKRSNVCCDAPIIEYRINRVSASGEYSVRVS